MTHALIIGGGIAGPATSMALRKAGISSTVYEAYPSGADDAGAFLMIMHNGMNALAALDAQQALSRHSFTTTMVEYVGPDGSQQALRPIGNRKVADGPRTFKRAELYSALHDELLRRGGTIEHGKSLVQAVRTSSGTVVASFSDGSQAEGDLLVGADGIGSTVRTIIDPQAPEPRYTGQRVIYGYSRDPSIPPAPDTFRMLRGPRAGLGYTTSPAGETFWYTRLPGAELSKAACAAMSPEQWRDHALDFFADDNPAAAHVIRATSDILGRSVYDIPSTPLWHRASMVLVGDAAHAASPAAAQGASMAMEDAVILAKCLRDIPDLDEAFSTYETIRRGRAEDLVAYSAPKPAEPSRAQNEAPAPSGDWLYSHPIDWDSPISPPPASQSDSRNQLSTTTDQVGRA